MKTIKTGVIGCGLIAQMEWLPYLHELKVLGADRIIYGTDNMDDMMTPEMIMELDILEEEKHMILGGTAKRVYNL